MRNNLSWIFSFWFSLFFRFINCNGDNIVMDVFFFLNTIFLCEVKSYCIVLKYSLFKDTKCSFSIHESFVFIVDKTNFNIE